MPSPARFLQTSGYFTAAEPPAVDSNVVVILATLLCALICVVGLALVARCAWLRRYVPSGPPPPPPPAPASKGLKKKALQSLPKVSFDGSGGGLADCAICLAEFAEGDEIRILPQCGHGFHVGCVDTWLGSHSSCPSCRRVLVVPPPPPRCRTCGASSGETSAAAAECGAKAREDGDANRFLP